MVIQQFIINSFKMTDLEIAIQEFLSNNVNKSESFKKEMIGYLTIVYCHFNWGGRRAWVTTALRVLYANNILQ